MRKKSLNFGKDGQIWINVGWKLTKSGKRSQPKFCLGESLKDAERRNARIEQLWEDIERVESDPLWDDFTTEIAKSLGKGELQHVVEQLPTEDHGDYANRINRLALRYPSVKFVPGDQNEYDDGHDHLVTFAEDTLESLKEQFGLTVKIGVVSSGTLHQAMDCFIEWIKKDYFDVEEGHVNDNGMTKIKQVVALKEYLSDIPLSDLGYQAVDELFSTLRQRPVSKRTGSPLKAKTCKNYIGELKRFLEWLDSGDEFAWQLPAKFNRIKRQPNELESDIDAEAADIFTFTVEHCRTLYRYAGPFDRLCIILGLNCAYGVDQTARLKLSEVMLEGDKPQIGRVRRKKKVFGQHRLWKHSIILLNWAIDRRESLKNETSMDFVLLKQSGVPYWRKTNGGNRARDIPNSWDRLKARIIEDHADFPAVGFNTLRDTSVHEIRKIGGAEIARVHATHKHHSSDKNLRRYSNAPWEKVFEAQERMEQLFAPMFEAVPDPTVVPKQAYVSLGKRDKMLELREHGLSVQEVAKQVGVHPMTVYRTFESHEQPSNKVTGIHSEPE